MLEENNDRLLNHLSDKITEIIGSINTVLIGTDPLTGINFILEWVDKEYVESHEKQLILKTFKVIQHIILNFFPESITNLDESIEQSMDQLYGKDLSIDDRDLLKELIFYAFCFFKDRYYRVFYPDTEYVTADMLKKGDHLITLFVGSQILKDLNNMLNFGIDPLDSSNGKNRDLSEYIRESISATRVLKLFKDRFWSYRLPDKKTRYYSVTEEFNRNTLIERIKQIMEEIGLGDFSDGYNASIVIACVTFLENKYIYKEDKVISKELAFIQEN